MANPEDTFCQLMPPSVPLHAPAEDPLAEDGRALLTLLVSGLKDEAIARQLGWSVRTMRRRISRLHELLGAANPLPFAADQGYPWNLDPRFAGYP